MIHLKHLNIKKWYKAFLSIPMTFRIYMQVYTTNSSSSCKLRVKVKFTLEEATKVQRGSTGIAVLFL
jgi:hypothetical protein